MLLLALIAAVITLIVSFSCGFFAGWQGLLIAAAVFVGSVLGLVMLHLLVCIVTSIFLSREKPMEKQNRFCRLLTDNTCKLFLDLGRARVHTTGAEKLPEGQRFLLVCNHRSMFDPMVCITELRKYNISFISKPENMDIPFAGEILNSCGFLAIDRENNRTAMRTINRAAEFIANDILSVGIYPEGTRSTQEYMLPFRSGAFKPALKAKAPVVVTTIRNTEQILKNAPFRSTDIYFDIVGVLTYEEIKGMRTGKVAAKAREMMNASLGITEEPEAEQEDAEI